jgi:Outer membrane protein beta-barrel domain
MKSDQIRMKRLPKIVAVSIFASIILSAQAGGQKTYALGIGGGAAIPVGKLSNTQVTGFNGIIALALGAPDLPVGVRFDGIYNNFSRKNVISAQGSATNTYGFRIAGILANVVYAFPGTSVKSYIVGGGGLYNTKLDVAGSKSENHAGLNAGAGLTFGLGPIASFIESRYHFISREPTKGGVIHFVPITFGLMF